MNKQLRELAKNIKKSYLNEKIEINDEVKQYLKNDENNLNTKMIMFKTFGLSNEVYNIFYEYSLLILDFKNELSEIFFKNLDDVVVENYTIVNNEYKQLTKMDKYNKIYSKNFQDCLKCVKTCYSNMIKSRLEWSKESPALSYLGRYYYRCLKDYLIDLKNKDKIKDYQLKVLKLLEYDEDRVIKIVNTRRNRLVRKCGIIKFSKLSFTNSNAINSYDTFITKYPQEIITLNKYKKQQNHWLKNKLHGKNLKVLKTNALIKVALGYNKYDLPIRLSDKYHNENILKTIANSYTGGSKAIRQMTNLIQIDEFKKEIIIKFAVKVSKQQISDTCNNVLGVDVNTKHNLFCCSNGKKFKVDDKLVKKIVSIEKKLKKQKNNKFKDLENEIKQNNLLTHEQKQEKLNEIKQLRKFNKFERLQATKNNRRKQYLLNYMSHELCKYTKSKGFDHIVIEDLTFKLKKSYIKNLEFDINYNDLFCILHLRELKNVIPRIANKYGITVSITPASYTSQMCSVCGYISSDNRKSQEAFHCQNCGHQENADINASKNIRNRITNPRYLKLLHCKTKDFNNRFEPKKIKYKTIKKLLNDSNRQLVLIYKYFGER